MLVKNWSCVFESRGGVEFVHIGEAKGDEGEDENPIPADLILPTGTARKYLLYFVSIWWDGGMGGE